MNIRLLSLLVLPLLVAVAAVAISSTETSAQQPMTRTFNVALFGREEFPGPGDPDGIGGARVTINPTDDEVCVSIGVAFIQPATMAHIHRGARGTAGPVVVDFTSLLIPAASLPVPGTSVFQGCVDATSAIIDEILANPSGFYVNVHNAQFPAGAVRGQMR
jgi:hypothetical protein